MRKGRLNVLHSREVFRHVSTMMLLRTFCLQMLPFALALSMSASEPVPLIHAHAHNDYEHKRPLFEALEHGFCSIEADIFLVDGQLLVSHNRQDCRPDRTLEKLYLAPLQEQVKKNGGRVYPGGPDVTLWIDIKLDPAKVQHDEKLADQESERTYVALVKVLQSYAPILTRYSVDKTETNAISIILTGAHPKSLLHEKGWRWAANDGLLSDVSPTTTANVVPAICENWTRNFQWWGKGEMPEAERQKLVNLVNRAHGQGRRVRFWATPENPAIWKELREAQVDWISLDDLDQGAVFLKNELKH